MLNLFTRTLLIPLALGAMAILIQPSLADPVTAQAGDTANTHKVEDMVLGNANAPVTVIEYASLTCPHCADFALTEFPEFKKEYIDTGKVRFIYRQFPTSPAELAVAADIVARCKGDAASFYHMLHVLYSTQIVWVPARNPESMLRQIADNNGISYDDFDKCMADPSVPEWIQAESEHAYKTWGVHATPSFVINDKFDETVHTLGGLQKAIDPLLAADKGKNTAH